MIRTGKLKIHL